MQLRPYQQESVEKVIDGFKEFDRQLLVLPVGAGKTICFSFLAKAMQPQKTLILAHREELVDQAIDKLYKATGIIAGKEKAEFRASRNDPVVVGSVQSLINRLDNWPANHFGLVVADEAHHAISRSWQSVLTHFTGAKILGVTATPDRGDQRNLGTFFENVAHEIGIFDLIGQRYLSKIMIKSVPLEINLDKVEQVNGDFDKVGLGNALIPYMDGIAKAIKLHAVGRKILVFLPLIATSVQFVEVCTAHGINARHIDGYSDERKAILKAFENRRFDLLSNAMLLGEGYDDPSIDCIVNLRPTRSRSLFSQIVGRGTRLFDGKKDLLLLDFLFTHERLSLVKPAHLIAKNEEEAQAITEMAQRETGRDSQGSMDLQDMASECREKREEALRKKLESMANRKAKFISAEEYALRHHKLDMAEWQPTMKWHADKLSDKQIHWLEQAGVSPDSVRGKGHALEILGHFFNNRTEEPASHKQRWAMKCAGWMSPDGLRGPFQATKRDALAFFKSRNKKSTSAPKVAPKATVAQGSFF